VTPSLETIVAGFEPKVRAALEAFLAAVGKSLSIAAVERYIAQGDITGLMAEIQASYIAAASKTGVLAVLTEVMVAAGTATEGDVNKAAESIRRANAKRDAQYPEPTLRLPSLGDYYDATGVVFYEPDAPMGFKFNPVNPSTVQATRTWQGNLIREMAEAERVAVMDLVREGVLKGQNPRATAIDIRDNLGLTKHQQGIVRNFGAEIDRIVQSGISSAQSWGLYTPKQIEELRLSDPKAFRDLNFTATERKVGRRWGKISRAGGTLAEGQKPIGFTKPPSTQGGENAFRINPDGSPKDRMTSWRLRDKTLDPLIYDIIRATEKGDMDALEAAKARLKAKAGLVKDRYYERYIKHRAQNIARTETLRAANLGQYESWRQAIKDSNVIAASDMQRKWVTAGDDRVRMMHRAANGQTVGFDEPFTVDGSHYMYPPAGVNCRCVATYKVVL